MNFKYEPLAHKDSYPSYFATMDFFHSGAVGQVNAFSKDSEFK